MPPLLPDLPVAKALPVLQQQLEELSTLSSHRYVEAKMQEEEWRYFTENVIEAAFGSSSPNLDKFQAIQDRGPIIGMELHERRKYDQQRFEHRVGKYKALLRGLVRTLGLLVPDAETQGVYESGDEFGFYRDMSRLFATAKTDILLVDPYFDHQVFISLDAVPKATPVRVLFSKPNSEVTTTAQKYGRSRSGPLELRSRSTKKIHDRVLFLDSRGWVSGQSSKDAARNQPTYLVELSQPLVTIFREFHEEIWKSATVVYPS